MIDSLTNEPVSALIDNEISILFWWEPLIQINGDSEAKVVNGKVLFQNMTLVGEAGLNTYLYLKVESQGIAILMNASNCKIL